MGYYTREQRKVMNYLALAKVHYHKNMWSRNRQLGYTFKNTPLDEIHIASDINKDVKKVTLLHEVGHVYFNHNSVDVKAEMVAVKELFEKYGIPYGKGIRHFGGPCRFLNMCMDLEVNSKLLTLANVKTMYDNDFKILTQQSMKVPTLDGFRDYYEVLIAQLKDKIEERRKQREQEKQNNQQDNQSNDSEELEDESMGSESSSSSNSDEGEDSESSPNGNGSDGKDDEDSDDEDSDGSPNGSDDKEDNESDDEDSDDSLSDFDDEEDGEEDEDSNDSSNGSNDGEDVEEDGDSKDSSDKSDDEEDGDSKDSSKGSDGEDDEDSNDGDSKDSSSKSSDEKEGDEEASGDVPIDGDDEGNGTSSGYDDLDSFLDDIPDAEFPEGMDDLNSDVSPMDEGLDEEIAKALRDENYENPCDNTPETEKTVGDSVASDDVDKEVDDPKNSYSNNGFSKRTLEIKPNTDKEITKFLSQIIDTSLDTKINHVKHWNRGTRRDPSGLLYTSISMTINNQKPKVGILIDVSGSMDTSSILRACNSLNAVSRFMAPDSLIVTWSTHKEKEFDFKHVPQYVEAGGGTNLLSGTRYLVEEKKCDIVVIYSDFCVNDYEIVEMTRLTKKKGTKVYSIDVTKSKTLGNIVLSAVSEKTWADWVKVNRNVLRVV